MGKMKKVTYVKFAIDIVMAVVFVLLFNKQVLGGMTFHEIAGLAIAVIFLTHVLLNAQWVKKVTLKIPEGEGLMGMEGGMRGGEHSASILGVLTTYFSIMSVFIVIVYYLKKMVFRKKRKNQLAAGV